MESADSTTAEYNLVLHSYYHYVTIAKYSTCHRVVLQVYTHSLLYYTLDDVILDIMNIQYVT